MHDLVAHSSYYLQRPRQFAQNDVLLESAATREAKLIISAQLLPHLSSSHKRKRQRKGNLEAFGTGMGANRARFKWTVT